MSTWLENLLMPPALVGWLLVALAWAARRPPVPAAARRLAWATAVLYFAAASPLGANALVGILEGASGRAGTGCAAPGRPRVVVILAGGLVELPERPDDLASLSETSYRRALEGLRVARAAPASRLVLSGGTGAGVREADLMAALVTGLGFPAERVVLERESTTTAEAADRVARLLAAPAGDGPVVDLVTSALHMPRAAATFRRRGLAVCPVPVDRRHVRVRLLDPGSLLPQITALDKTTVAVHELLGWAAYRVSGRL